MKEGGAHSDRPLEWPAFALNSAKLSSFNLPSIWVLWLVSLLIHCDYSWRTVVHILERLASARSFPGVGELETKMKLNEEWSDLYSPSYSACWLCMFTLNGLTVFSFFSFQVEKKINGISLEVLKNELLAIPAMIVLYCQTDLVSSIPF